MKVRSVLRTGLLTAIVGAASMSAYASHTWNNYHWARNTTSFTLQVIDSNSSSWDDELAQALTQWSRSSRLDMRVTSYDSSSSTRSSCPMVSGKVRSCNYAYGSNGWLGLASINLDSRGHISTGSSKMNDSYSSSFASQDERNHVMCQELGHTLGLGHTSEDGSSQGTCMDYSQSPNSTIPNSHDFSQLYSQYLHTDTYNSYSSSAAFAAMAVIAAKSESTPLTTSQRGMAGKTPMGVRMGKGVFDETWVAPDGKGGVWVHHILLAPGFEHTELLPKSK